MAPNAEQIFHEARGMAPAEQGAYLKGACGGDAALRAKVEGLLKAEAEAEAGDFLKTSGEPAPAAGSATDAATLAAPIHEGPGTRIGPYKLLQAIGEGGFGSVFMAEQEKPVQRKVALKIIKLGMDTRQVVARFEQERQALAMMDHPNIARVLDAGATETGRPFFVMELVKGDPIVEYADKNNLSIEDRLELFAQVCNAVQHAHTKGIIHRDIKPSNILVSTQDGRPHCKVIDFGIAKATASKLTEKTLFTEHRALIGTPEYMSPEQAEGSLDIDTRTDVYSLGVLLYELLTGTTPFSGKELRSAAYAEIQRIIREVEPPKPSTRISANTDTIASVAAKRHTEPRRLGPIVRGELDWIVMKALEKDRQRRYETANGLGMDIRRYLAGEAVLAAPPSAAYRLKTLIRRNRGPVAAVAAVAAVLVLGLIGTSLGLVMAERARRVALVEREAAEIARAAEAEQRLAAEAARAEAEAQEAEAVKQSIEARAAEAEASRQAEIAEAVATFQTQMLAAVDPNQLPTDPVTGEPLKDAVTVLQALRAAVKLLDEGGSALQDQPMVEARVRATIGNTLRGLARYDEAEPNLRRSLEILRASLPAGDPGIAAGLQSLAELLRVQNRLAEAEPLYREAIAILRAALPAGHPDIARGLNNLAALLHAQSKFAEAAQLYREALAIRRAALPAGHPDIGVNLNNLASLLRAQNKLAEAEPLFREALAITRAAFPDGHPGIAAPLNNLASLLQAQNKLAEAEPLFREVLEIRRATLPAGHPDIASGLHNLASLLQDQGKFVEAEPLYREALEIWRAALPAGHPHIAAGLNSLADLLRNQNRLAEAEPLLREAVEIWRAALPAGHPDIAGGLSSLALLLDAQNKIVDAEPLSREALDIWRAALPAGHPRIAAGLANLAGLYWRQGKLDQSIPMFEECLHMTEAALGRQHPTTLNAIANLGVNYKDAGRLAEAIALLEEAYRASHREPSIAWVAQPLMGAYLRTATPEGNERAMALAQDALATARATVPEGSPELAAQLAALGMTLLTFDAWDEAEPLFREALEIRRASLPAGHPDIAFCVSNLARVQQGLGNTSEARAGFDEAIAMLRQESPDGSPQLVRTLWRSGTARLENKDLAAALAELEEAVSIGEKVLPADHAHLTEYRETLAACRAAMAEQANPAPAGGGG